MLIAIDHGNKQMKTVNHAPFTSGITESEVPPFGGEVLHYQGKYYTLTEQRIPYRRDKTGDERFFILTLFAIAYEIDAARSYSSGTMHIQLAVGLPPAHYGAQYRAFTRYFENRGEVQFALHGRSYAIFIDKVSCFPQSYAAAVTMFRELRETPKALVLDIGGFTTDYLQIRNGECDLSVCDSLENGVIHLYNRVKSRVSAEQDVLLDEAEIDSVLLGNPNNVPPAAAETVRRLAREFVSDLFSSLRERMVELRSGRIILIGGGSILLKEQIKTSGRIGSVTIIDDIRANVRGYELLFRYEQLGR